MPLEDDEYDDAIKAVATILSDKLTSDMNDLQASYGRTFGVDASRQAYFTSIYQGIGTTIGVLLAAGAAVGTAGIAAAPAMMAMAAAAGNGSATAAFGAAAIPGAAGAGFAPVLTALQGGVMPSASPTASGAPNLGTKFGGAEAKQQQGFADAVAFTSYALALLQGASRSLVLTPLILGYCGSSGDTLFSNARFRWFWNAGRLFEAATDGNLVARSKATELRAPQAAVQPAAQPAAPPNPPAPVPVPTADATLAKEAINKLKSRAAFFAKRGFYEYVRDASIVGHDTAANHTATATDMMRAASPGDTNTKTALKNNFVDVLPGAIKPPEADTVFGTTKAGAIHGGSNNPFRMATGALRFEWGQSDTELARIEIFVAWFIIHKCLQLRTGTPLPLFLPPTKENAENVVRGLLDVLEVASLVPYFYEKPTAENRLLLALESLPLVNHFFGDAVAAKPQVPAPQGFAYKTAANIDLWGTRARAAWALISDSPAPGRLAVKSVALSTNWRGTVQPLPDHERLYIAKTKNLYGKSWEDKDNAARIKEWTTGAAATASQGEKDTDVATTDSWYIRKDLLDHFTQKCVKPPAPPQRIDDNVVFEDGGTGCFFLNPTPLSEDPLPSNRAINTDVKDAVEKIRRKEKEAHEQEDEKQASAHEKATAAQAKLASDQAHAAVQQALAAFSTRHPYQARTVPAPQPNALAGRPVADVIDDILKELRVKTVNATPQKTAEATFTAVVELLKHVL